jgi:hypothetical protein
MCARHGCAQALLWRPHNKARSVGPGPLSAQPWCRPKGVGRSCARFLLGNSRDRFGSGGFQLWSELPALAPGARCRVGRSVGSGAPEAGPLTVQWTAVQARNVRDPLRVLEQGPDRQRAPTGCSGGVSSINGASESRCSHDGSATRSRQGQHADRDRSSREAMALHERGLHGARTGSLGDVGRIPRA